MKKEGGRVCKKKEKEFPRKRGTATTLTAKGGSASQTGTAREGALVGNLKDKEIGGSGEKKCKKKGKRKKRYSLDLGLTIFLIAKGGHKSN